MNSNHTFSIIVETENLGMAGFEDLESSLDSIKSQTFPVAKILEVVLIVGGHLSVDVLDQLNIKYPWVRVHLEKSNLDYAKSKMKGAEVVKGSILIFADSDMRYEKSWLGNIVEAIQTHPSGTIVSGDTRLETNSAYALALNATWMIQVLSDKITRSVPTTFFPLNNFAIEKSLMLKLPLPYDLPLYRNKIPIWERQLLNHGCQIVRAPGTRGYHAPPGTLGDWWYRMLIYGADFVAQADFSVNEKNEIVESKNVLGRLYKLIFLCPWKIEQLLLNSFKLIREDSGRLPYLPGGVIIGLANCAVVGLGALVACFDRDFIFKKINAREADHIV